MLLAFFESPMQDTNRNRPDSAQVLPKQRIRILSLVKKSVEAGVFSNQHLHLIKEKVDYFTDLTGEFYNKQYAEDFETIRTSSESNSLLIEINRLVAKKLSQKSLACHKIQTGI